MPIRIRPSKIDTLGELGKFRDSAARSGHGAVATFTGLMRGIDESTGEMIRSMELEHYPAMTQKQLKNIASDAAGRWKIGEPLIVHRVGKLRAGEDIVLVAVSSRHRRDAFEACEFIVDFLKTRAPFWKKETTSAGSRWVEQGANDEADALRWEKKSG